MKWYYYLNQQGFLFIAHFNFATDAFPPQMSIKTSMGQKLVSKQ